MVESVVRWSRQLTDSNAILIAHLTAEELVKWMFDSMSFVSIWSRCGISLQDFLITQPPKFADRFSYMVG